MGRAKTKKPAREASQRDVPPLEAAPVPGSAAETLPSGASSGPSGAGEADPWMQWLSDAPAVVAGLYVLILLFVFVRRVRYPFALEWIESGLLDEVRWLAGGHGLYVRPSVDFVPFVYNPLYFWVCAAASKVLGVSFLTLRLVSALSSLATLGLLYALVVEETGNRAAGILGAGTYAASFKESIEFMDVARVDALFLFIGVASIWVLRTRPTRWWRAMAGALLVLCFLAKQTGVIFAAPLLLFVARDEARNAASGLARWRGVLLGLAVVAGVGASVYLLDATSGGWYRYYAFGLTTHHPLVASMWTEFWTKDVLASVAIATLGALFVVIGPSGLASRERELWAAALVAALLTSWSGRLHDGGWANVLMPAYAVLSALFAIAVHAAMTYARQASAGVGPRLAAFVSVGAVIQIAALAYDPRSVLPTERDEAAGWRVVAALHDAPGDTFVPTDSYLSVLAGKRPHLHEMAVDDILTGPPSEIQAQLVREISAALHEHRWAMVITDDDWFAGDVRASYQRGPDAVADETSFYPLSGVHYRPGSIYTPK